MNGHIVLNKLQETSGGNVGIFIAD